MRPSRASGLTPQARYDGKAATETQSAAGTMTSARCPPASTTHAATIVPVSRRRPRSSSTLAGHTARHAMDETAFTKSRDLGST